MLLGTNFIAYWPLFGDILTESHLLIFILVKLIIIYKVKLFLGSKQPKFVVSIMMYDSEYLKGTNNELIWDGITPKKSSCQSLWKLQYCGIIALKSFLRLQCPQQIKYSRHVYQLGQWRRVFLTFIWHGSHVEWNESKTLLDWTFTVFAHYAVKN